MMTAVAQPVGAATGKKPSRACDRFGMLMYGSMLLYIAAFFALAGIVECIANLGTLSMPAAAGGAPAAATVSPDCAGADDCPSVVIVVRDKDDEAFRRRLALAALNHGGEHGVAPDREEGTLWAQLPRSAVAELSRLHRDFPLLQDPYNVSFYRWWALRWSAPRDPAAAPASDGQLTTLFVTIRNHDGHRWVSPAIALVASGSLLALGGVCGVKNRRRQREEARRYAT